MIDWSQITLSVSDRERLGIAAEPSAEVRYVAMRLVEGHWLISTLIPRKTPELAEETARSIWPEFDHVICPVVLPVKEASSLTEELGPLTEELASLTKEPVA